MTESFFRGGFRLRASRLRRDRSACALPRASKPWEGPSSSHDPSFSRASGVIVFQGRDRQALGVPSFSCEAASLLEMQWRPCRANGSATARRPYPLMHECAAARGLTIDEVAARVSFTVETTVLPSFALPRGACSGVSMSAGKVLALAKHIIQPRMARIFTNREQLRCRFSLLVLFVFIRGIRGSRTSGQHERTAWLDHR